MMWLESKQILVDKPNPLPHKYTFTMSITGPEQIIVTTGGERGERGVRAHCDCMVGRGGGGGREVRGQIIVTTW